MKTDSGASQAVGRLSPGMSQLLWGSVVGCPCCLTGARYVLPPHGADHRFCPFGGWLGSSERQQPGWSSVTSGWAGTAGAGMEPSGWHRSPRSAAPPAVLSVGAQQRRDPFSAVRHACDARDALRSAVRSGQALRGLANPLQQSSYSLFQIPSLNWLIRAGRSVWHCHMCRCG